jgi:hypothetical protein
MVIKPEDCQKYKCCVRDEQCIGVECMAWRGDFTFFYDDDGKLKDMKNSGLGYCGIVYK